MGAQAAPHSPVLLEGIAEKAFKQPKNHPRLGIGNGMGCRPSPPCQPHCNATQWQWGGCIFQLRLPWQPWSDGPFVAESVSCG